MSRSKYESDSVAPEGYDVEMPPRPESPDDLTEEEEEVDPDKMIEPLPDLSNVPQYVDNTPESDSDLDGTGPSGPPVYKVYPDEPPGKYHEPVVDEHAAKRDPKYMETVDPDDDDADFDIDKVDFSTSDAFGDGVPENFMIASEPSGIVEDVDAIPITIINRDEWGAKPYADNLEGLYPLNHKIPYIHLEYTTGTDPCYKKEDCIKTVLEIQRRHMEDLGLPDIKYNFLIGGDGNAYEGRGWHLQPDKGNELPMYNGKYVEFAFIGDFTKKWEPPRQNKVQWGLIGEGTRENFIEHDLDFICKSQVIELKHDPNDDW